MLKNLSLKILSVLIALSLWLIVATSDTTEMKIYVPIKLENISEGFLAETKNSLLNVEIKGSSLMLQSISHNDILISINVANFSVGNRKYKIKNSDVKAPNGVEVVRIEPQEILINVDKLIQKKVKVIPTFIGEPKEGFKVETVNIFPSVIMITGAESKLLTQDFIETLPINLSGRNEAVIYGTGMKVVNGFKNASPEQVDVFVNFSEDITEETFEIFNIDFINKQGFKYKITPQSVKIKVKGRKDRLTNSNIHKNLRLYVDFSDISSTGKFLREINKVVNDNVKILSMTPKNVRIEVTE